MYYIIVILSVLIASFAQMLLKKGAALPHESFIGEYLNRWVIGGYALLGLSLIANIFAMSHGIQVKDVSIIESLSYLFVPLLSLLLFRDRIGWRKWVAIAVILAGVFLFFA
jgi:drug/metabolite transporter (DMT)-like permease